MVDIVAALRGKQLIKAAPLRGVNIGERLRGAGLLKPHEATASTGLDQRFVRGLAKLETADGKKTIREGDRDTFNLFNIKGKGPAGSVKAVDKAEGSNDSYRAYNSPEESVADLNDLLARKYPDALKAKTGREFAEALKRGGYATDPDYVSKLTAVIDES